MRLAYLSDIHFGQEEDLRAYHFALTLLKPLGIDTVFLGGDIYDHTAVSRYTKTLEAEGKFQDELDHGFKELTRLREKLPAVPMHFLPGNHEVRLVSYLQNKARPLAGLRCLSYEKLYRLEELGIEYHEEGKPVKFGHLYLAHGHEFPTGGANPAMTALNKVNNNLLFGHVHRPSVAVKTELGGRGLVAYSNPCLGTLTPDYRLAPDWAQGFSIVDFTPSGCFSVTQIIFWREDDRLATMVEGKLYRERKSNGR